MPNGRSANACMKKFRYKIYDRDYPKPIKGIVNAPTYEDAKRIVHSMIRGDQGTAVLSLKEI